VIVRLSEIDKKNFSQGADTNKLSLHAYQALHSSLPHTKAVQEPSGTVQYNTIQYYGTALIPNYTSMLCPDIAHSTARQAKGNSINGDE
jgi:hypothetical protein